MARTGEGQREAERKAFKIAANRRGFDELETWMTGQGEPVSLVLMESSGHYWWNLASHLRRHGYEVAVVNPLEAKYFAKCRLQRSKSDPADARTLAALGMHDQPRTSDPLVGAELKEAARFAMRLVGEQAEACQRIQRLVDVGFPELREVWDDPTCVSALAVLRKAQGAALREEGGQPRDPLDHGQDGNAYLRAAAFRMAIVGIQHNPIIRDHYARKRAAGKSAMNAVGHCMSKSLSLVWGVWPNGVDWDPTRQTSRLASTEPRSGPPARQDLMGSKPPTLAPPAESNACGRSCRSALGRAWPSAASTPTAYRWSAPSVPSAVGRMWRPPPVP